MSTQTVVKAAAALEQGLPAAVDVYKRQSLFNDILLLVDRQQHEQKKATGDVQEQIERAAAYFNENYNTKISIDDYAESLHISTNWFIHNFKQMCIRDR